MNRKSLLIAAQASSLAIALVGLAGTASAQDQTPTPTPAPTQTEAREEIVVTATKREQAISQTPMPVTALTGEQLANANAQSLADYITRVPGVVFNDYQPGISEVVIRGIAATTYHEQGQTTTGYYMNEIPLVEPGWPIGIPDVDTFDLDRVEVLRGPQGTLFGSSSLGGLVNYVVKVADPTGFDAAASGLIGTTKNSHGDINYAAKVMVNVPIISDVLAVRLMALQRFDAGYLDNPGTGVEGSNDFRTRGLRGSIVFTPGVDTTITYLSTYQDTKFDDQSYLDTNNPYIRITQAPEPQETDFWLNSLRLDQKFDFATLTVFGSLVEKNNETVFSYPYPYVTGNVTGADAAVSLGTADATIKTVEARLASPGGEFFNWLIGTSYMHAEKSGFDQIFQRGAEAYIDAHPGSFPGPGSVLAPDDRIYGYLSEGVNEDFGIFGEISIKPVPEFELILGGRYYSNRYNTTVNNLPGAVSGSLTGSSATVEESEDGFTPKVSLVARPSENFMAFLTYSQGYRVGGINPNAGFLPTIPLSYGSDTTDNYEAGVKFSVFDKALYIEASVFSVDWTNIQARLFGPAPNYYSYVTNAGGANVGGVELSATAQLAPFASFSTNITYQDAQLTSFLPDTFAVGGGYKAGTTLPGSSRWSVANNLRFDFGGSSSLAPTFEIAHRYLSSAPVAFGNPNTRGDFNIIDLRASITAFDNFKLLVFANNVFDEFGILNAPFTDQLAPAGSIVRPRTVGIRLDWSL